MTETELSWAAIQDWMCEPFIIAKTGLSVREHQQRTIDNWHLLTLKAGDLPWVPVLQGWRQDDYLRHVEDYARAGCDLTRQPLVGLGSVCRRQATDEVAEIVAQLHARGIRLHGFGFKLQGLRAVGHLLASADSMAWSYVARRDVPMDGCTHTNCANCLRYALAWRERVLRSLRKRDVQRVMVFG